VSSRDSNARGSSTARWRVTAGLVVIAAVMGAALWFVAGIVLFFVNPAWEACDNFWGTHGRVVVGGIETGLGYPSFLVGAGLLAVVAAIVRLTPWRLSGVAAGLASYAAWFVALYFLGEPLFGPHRCVDAGALLP
jgi:hypothetical protein